MRILLILLMSLFTSCMDGTALSTLRLPIAAALPGDVIAVEVRIDGRVYRVDRPFPEPFFIEVGAGAIDLIEVIGDGSQGPILYGQATALSVADGATVDVDVVLDPAGIARVFTIESLGTEIGIVAVPANPPPSTPTRYTLPFDQGAYSRVVPAGEYDIRAVVDIGIGVSEVDIGTVTVDVGAAENAALDLSALEMLGDAF